MSKLSNRYARVHLLFRILAETKLEKQLRIAKDQIDKIEIRSLAKQTKTEYKRNLGIDSLKDLNDNQLEGLETQLVSQTDFLSKLIKRGNNN